MAEYKGTVELIGGLTPKNNGEFALMHAKDIQVDNTGKRLNEKLAEIEGNGGTGGGVITIAVDSTKETATLNSATIYELVRDGNAVVVTMDGVQYQYVGATHFADDGMCDTVTFYRTDVDDNGTVTSVYVNIYDDLTTNVIYKEAETGGSNSGIHIGEEAPTNGEVLWVDTDETIVDNGDGEVVVTPTVKAATPDWNANEGEDGYVKNRTHYVDEKGVVHKLPNKFIDADWMATSEDGGAGKVVFIPEQTVSGGMWSGIQSALVEGERYAVEVNGVMYECVCHIYDGTLYLGNGTLLGGTEGRSEPFCIAWMGGTAQGGYFYNDGTLESPIGIKVSDWQDTVYNKLPEKFLPDNVVKGEGGKVHIDDVLGGISWDKVSGKPFIDGAGEPFFTHTATFATDTAAKNGVIVSGASVTSILDTLYWLDVNGKLLKCHWERASFNSNLYDEDGNRWVTNTLSGVYVNAQTAGTYTFTLYEPTEDQMIEPQYLPPNLAKKFDIPTSGGADIDVTAQVGQTIIVKEVDSNGKPTKWESADYPLTVNEIIPQTAVTPVYNSSYSCYMWNFANGTKLIAGQKYTVIFDGVEYKCTAKKGAFSGMSLTYIGNDVLFGNNTGEPFALASILGNEGYIVLMGFDGNEHTVSLSGIKVADCYIKREEYVYPINVNNFSGTGTGDTREYDVSELPVALVKAARDGVPLYMLITDNNGRAVKMPASFTMAGIVTSLLDDLLGEYTESFPSTEVAALFPILCARGMVNSSIQDYIIRFVAGAD